MNSQSLAFGKIKSNVIPILLLVMLSACTAANKDNSDASVSGLTLSNSKLSWFKANPKYSELANGPLAGEIGNSLSAAAKKQAIEAEYSALENKSSGETTVWQYSDRQKGKIISYPPYQVGSSNCRRYLHSVNVNGDVSQAIGTACRDKAGIWTPLT